MNELKWAVEKARNWNDPDQSFEDTNKALDIILDLATRVLEVEGMMPKEKPFREDSPRLSGSENYGLDMWDNGYNQARQECILAVTKKCGELEEVIIKFCDEYYDNKPNDVKLIVHDAFKPLAHALQSHLLGEKG